MPSSSKYEWYFLRKPNQSDLKATRESFHQAVQCVAAVGRTFSTSEEVEQDQNAKLVWVPGLWRMAGTWVEGAQSFRSSISLKDKKLYLVEPRLNILDELALQGHTYNELMLWVEQQIIKLELSTASISTEFPYQLPHYAQDFRKTFHEKDLSQSEVLGGHYHDAYILFQSFSESSSHSPEVYIYPHHFDMETKIVLKKTDDLSTDTFIRLGFSPGDQLIDQPYLYINGWPQITGEKLPKAPLSSYWVESDWYGLALEFSAIYNRPDQADYMHQFLKEGLQVFRSLLLD